MELGDLLREEQLDAEHIMVLRHRPFEPGLETRLRAWALERIDLYDSYQSTHGERVEKALKGATHLVSMVAYGPGRALFVGIYENRGARPISLDQYWEIPEHIEMKQFGMKGFTAEERRDSIDIFDLRRTEMLQRWSGKLVVEWPGIERSWWRWASRNHFPIYAIYDENRLVDKVLAWDDLVLSWRELSTLPSLWRAAMQQWRGIYRVFDKKAGKAYIGSAYGKDNILGRWLNYASTGDGGNMLLRARDPENFEFSILQLVSLDVEANEIIHLEDSWKRRLQTRAPDGLNKN